MNQFANPYMTTHHHTGNAIRTEFQHGGRGVERVADVPMRVTRKTTSNHTYGLYDNPLLFVTKPSARPWRRIIREIEHALRSADSRVWLNDQELTGLLTINEITQRLMGIRTVIIQIDRNDTVVSRLYATLGNSEFSLIGENRWDKGNTFGGQLFNFNEFITKELNISSHDARIVCLNFIRAVTKLTYR